MQVTFTRRHRQEVLESPKASTSVGGTPQLTRSPAASSYRIPDDILWKIFSLVGDPVLPTHVCRTWRLSALNYSLLWTDITIDHYHSRRDAYLLRSHASPLSVSCQNSCEKNCTTCAGSLKVVLKHMFRIRTFEVLVTEASLSCLMDKFAKFSAPALMSMVLLGTVVSNERAISFLRGLPALLNLTIRNVSVECPHSMLINLTYVCLNMQDSAFGSDSLKRLIELMKTCSRLQTFILQGNLFSYDASVEALVSAPKTTIWIPFLSKFSLINVPFPLCQYFSQIIKSSKQIKWYVQNDEVRDRDDDPRGAFLQTVLDLAGNGSIESDSMQRPTRTLSVTFDLRTFHLFVQNSLACDGFGTECKSNDGESTSEALLELSLSSSSKYLFELHSALSDVCNRVSSTSKLLRIDTTHTRSLLNHYLESPIQSRCRSISYDSILKHSPLLEELHVRIPCSTSVRGLIWGKERRVIDSIFWDLQIPRKNWLKSSSENGMNNQYLVEFTQLSPHLHSVIFEFEKLAQPSQIVSCRIERKPVSGTTLHLTHFVIGGKTAIAPRCYAHAGRAVVCDINLLNHIRSILFPAKLCLGCFCAEYVSLKKCSFERAIENSLRFTGKSRLIIWIPVLALASPLVSFIASDFEYFSYYMFFIMAVVTCLKPRYSSL